MCACAHIEDSMQCLRQRGDLSSGGIVHSMNAAGCYWYVPAAAAWGECIYSHWKAFVENSTILPVKPCTQAREVLCVVCVWYVVCGAWCTVFPMLHRPLIL